MTEEKKLPTRKKSETRKKAHIIGVRVSPVEQAEIEAAAEAAGLTVASFIRVNILNNLETETRTAPRLDKTLLSQLLAQLGKVGSNINQIARRLNEGGQVGADRVTAACDEFAFLRDEIIKAIRCLDYDYKGKLQSGSSPSGPLSS